MRMRIRGKSGHYVNKQTVFALKCKHWC